ncbi:MAG: hypothetical protein WCD79_12185 [Chthoniobacteraceae bacterium]
MRPVEEIQPVNDRLIFWQGYDPAVKVDLSSHALLTPDGWVIVDPIPLNLEALDELLSGKTIVAILITSANHERAAAPFRMRCGAPVVAHCETATGLTIMPDQLLEGDAKFHGLTVIPLPGFVPGEIALHTSDHSGMMLMGDALINLQPDGLEMLPAKYCANPAMARKSLQKLLQFSFEVMTFAHGLPITTGAKLQFENLLK